MRMGIKGAPFQFGSPSGDVAIDASWPCDGEVRGQPSGEAGRAGTASDSFCRRYLHAPRAVSCVGAADSRRSVAFGMSLRRSERVCHCRLSGTDPYPRPEDGSSFSCSAGAFVRYLVAPRRSPHPTPERQTAAARPFEARWERYGCWRWEREYVVASLRRSKPHLIHPYVASAMGPEETF